MSIFLWLLFASPIFGLITYKNESWLNIDLGRIPFQYNVTSPLGIVSFNQYCEMVEISVESEIAEYRIIMVDGLVDNSSCDYDVQLSMVKNQFKAVNLVIFMSFSAESEAAFAEYSLADQSSEPLGTGLEDNGHPAANLTLISAETTYQLSMLPQNALITVTSNPSSAMLFFTGTPWLTMRWVFFICYVLCFIYSIYAFVVGLKLAEYQYLKARPLSLFICILSSACKVIEYGVDPFYSTGYLTWGGFLVVFWYTFLGLFVVISIISLTWVKIAFSVSAMSVRFKNLFKIFAYFSIFAFWAMFTANIILMYYTQTLAFVIIFIFILFFITVQIILVAYSAVRVGYIVQTVLQNSTTKYQVTKRIVVIVLILETALVLLVIAQSVYIAMTFIPGMYTQTGLLALMCCLNSAILFVLVSAFYFFSVHRLDPESKEISNPIQM